ncbi:MAG: (d)CMP kinase [Fibrobacter sp.]|nr:(d)CMP kinase [Fibrobacter sp.]
MATSSEHFVIALDGGSGTGKSTTAKLVAKTLGITYLDTGAMYRAVTFAALEKGLPAEEGPAMDNLLKELKLSFDSENHILINGVSYEQEIRGMRVSNNVSVYCALPSVRAAMTDKQREIGASSSCILDGRDIGTVVFPNAKYKFFMVTDVKVRAERRYKELLERGEKVTLEEVLANLVERDRLDSSRATAPLKKADDAIEIDTTHISIQQQVQKILDYVGVVA